MDRFGGMPKVHDYHDEEESRSIAILTCEDAPQDGLKTVATLGLSDFEALGEANQPLAFGVELIAAIEGEAASFERALSTCAFNVIKDRMRIYPGAAFPRVFDLYEDLSETMSHAFFVDPFIWGGTFETMTLPSKTVAFLQLVPISDGEFAYLRENGSEALEAVFESNQIDVFDMKRPSTI